MFLCLRQIWNLYARRAGRHCSQSLSKILFASIELEYYKDSSSSLNHGLKRSSRLKQKRTFFFSMSFIYYLFNKIWLKFKNANFFFNTALGYKTHWWAPPDTVDDLEALPYRASRVRTDWRYSCTRHSNGWPTWIRLLVRVPVYGDSLSGISATREY